VPRRGSTMSGLFSITRCATDRWDRQTLAVRDALARLAREAALIEALRLETDRAVITKLADILRSDLLALRGWRAPARLLREHLLPPRGYILASYGRTRASLLPALYLHRNHLL
jgi:hypothetical protein